MLLISGLFPSGFLSLQYKYNKMANNGQDSVSLANSGLTTTIKMGDSSAPTYTQYVAKFQDQSGNLDLSSCSEQAIHKSMDDMRLVLKEFNVLLNKMMDKNYELLAAKDPVVQDADRDIEILRAQLENSRKMILNQQAEIHNLHAIEQQMLGKGKEDYEQRLLDEIAEIKAKMPQVELHSKHNACDINRNGYTLVNREQDSTMYTRVNILKGDIDRAYDRWRKTEEKAKLLDERLRQFQQKSYEITSKMDEAIQKAKQHNIVVTSTGSIISFQERYDQLLKQREHERKKNLLLEHVNKTNDANLSKKIADMKKLLSEYNSKYEDVKERILKVQSSNQQIVNKSNIMGELTQRSLPYMYAQTLLKGDRKRPSDALKDSRVSQSVLEEGQKPASLPKFHKRVIGKNNTVDRQRYGKSVSKNEISTSKKAAVIYFQNEEPLIPNNKSHMFHIRKRQNQSEQQRVKHWRKQPQEEQEEQDKSPPAVSIKPRMNLRRRGNLNKSQMSGMPSEEDKLVPKFARRGGKEGGSQMSDEYMTYLEEKGRKILGL